MTWGPVEIQILIGALRSACEEMGGALIRSAYSANIKERRDCSTAIFDPDAELIMQAEHIPVHLGSMPSAVEAVAAEEQAPGRTWIVNDPYSGGTHLPDITLVSPVFDNRGRQLAFVAGRAHHADVGGTTPGSMPAGSTTLDEEGVVIPPSVLDEGLIESLVARMRVPAQRRADLRAQLAANRIGADRVLELSERYGPDRLREGFKALLEHSEARARAAIEALPDGAATASDRLELDRDGRTHDVVLRLRARIEGGGIRLDFAGTDPQVSGNLNCPLAVTRAACIFAVRTLTDPDAPASAGGHRPIAIEAPEGSVLNARPPAAVAAGNVETSSRVADLVIAALAELIPAPAAGQGTMNNVTLASASGADREWTYYETLGGGQGGGPAGPGPSAVHVGMSNTLNTPVEALESEFPLRVRRLELRRGSGGAGGAPGDVGATVGPGGGGAGAAPGGDGIVREIEALEPLRYSLIGERRRIAPAGRGGEPGATGRDRVNGESVGAKSEGRMEPGDLLRVETPGGGGFGAGP